MWAAASVPIYSKPAPAESLDVEGNAQVNGNVIVAGDVIHKGDTDTKIEIYNPIDSDAYASATVITNFEYEQNQQDEMRKIRLLDPSYIGQFVNEYKNLMKESII